VPGEADTAAEEEEGEGEEKFEPAVDVLCKVKVGKQIVSARLKKPSALCISPFFACKNCA
jgi:hypothetical protein